MWGVTLLIVAIAWAVSYARSRSLAYAGDRFEVAVLQPLTVTYGLMASGFALERSWLLAGLLGAGCLITAMMGTARHPHAEFSDLARGSERGMVKGPPGELDNTESFRIAQLLLPSSWLAGTVLAVALWGHKIVPWFIAIPLGVVGGVVFPLVGALIINRPIREGEGKVTASTPHQSSRGGAVPLHTSDPGGNTPEMRALSTAIIEAAGRSASTLLPLYEFDSLTEGEARRRSVVIAEESAFLLMFLAQRVASSELDEAARDQFIGELGPAVLRPLNEILNRDRPTRVAELFNDANGAAREYAKCTDVVGSTVLGEDGLVGVLARRVGSRLGTVSDVAFQMGVAQAVDQEIEQLDELPTLVRRAGHLA